MFFQHAGHEMSNRNYESDSMEKRATTRNPQECHRNRGRIPRKKRARSDQRLKLTLIIRYYGYN